MVAAFRLEQSDYRARLEAALNQLDKAVARASPNGPRHGSAGESRAAGAPRAARASQADLEAVDRSTEQDWATLRTKIERDLECTGRESTDPLPAAVLLLALPEA